ncbi:MAG: hypothetical protein HC778_07810 [Chamaesiphon sp. CSU_1_12]|nr:hypothetical protein [Chamaesiphon sp. CSU_1_12]
MSPIRIGAASTALTADNANDLQANAAQRPKAYLPGSVFPGTYRIGAPAVPIAYAAASFPPGGGVTIAYSDWESIGASLDAAVSRHLAFDAVLLPVRIGRPIALVVKDLTSGVTLFDGEFGAPPPSGEITVLPVDAFGDTKPPFPQGGSPLQFFALSASPSQAELARGITASFAGGTLTVTAAANALPPNVQARLLGLDATASYDWWVIKIKSRYLRLDRLDSHWVKPIEVK